MIAPTSHSMVIRSVRLGLFLALAAIAGPAMLLAQSAPVAPHTLSLQDLRDFREPPASWRVAGGAIADRDQANALTVTPGTGVLVNLPATGDAEDLYTTWEHGDIDLALDFMMPKGSSSGIYLQGRYELKLLDSWGIRRPGDHDLGALYPRADEGRAEGQQSLGGKPPRLNAGRAPGLWQHLEIRFRAPRFDSDGRKTENARLALVTLNGSVIHRDVEITGPSAGAMSDEEVAMGPLRIQGRLGPIAIRNVSIRPFESDSASTRDRNAARSRPPAAITVEPAEEAVVQRSFIVHGDAKRTHAVSVGDPTGVHYSYDLGEGALLQAWRGPFLETTEMWTERGEAQTAEPLGSVLLLPGTPALAHLAGGGAAWPDSLDAGADYRFEGYSLDDAGRPTFLYSLGGAEVQDRIEPTPDSLSLRREIRVTAPSDVDGLYARIATGSTVRKLDDGSYEVDDFRYYVVPGGGAMPLVRQSDGGQEILIPVTLRDGHARVSYEIIW